MGIAAQKWADQVLVTDDNPRDEDPAHIRAQILKGCPGAAQEGDRSRAIERAILSLGAGDSLLIAGKGHETLQIHNGYVTDFDDRAVARSFLDRYFLKVPTAENV
jgi:UDP-N-acetylmuramoyl-L-alanyl-D-glutamate--2,6-diaminopimelate ligase